MTVNDPGVETLQLSRLSLEGAMRPANRGRPGALRRPAVAA
jgi:hypothetical protein